MKKKKYLKYFLFITGCLIAVGFSLTACSGHSEAESDWRGAQKSKSLILYVQQNKDKMDMEQLKKEADSADSSLNRQFKATALLCALEYTQSQNPDPAQVPKAGDNLSSQYKDGIYHFNYPISSPYADQFLAKVNTEGEEFWKALNNAFPPYYSIKFLLAASSNLDAQTVVTLYKNNPENAQWNKGLSDTIDSWIAGKPAIIVKYGDGLKEAGYFDNWDEKQYKDTFFSRSSFKNSPVFTQEADQAIQYVSYVRNTFLTYLLSKYEMSAVTGEDTISTGLTVTIDQPLQLNSQNGEELPQTIETEGKKVAAFFQNPHADEFEGSPPALQLLGDFMLNLPDGEVPQSAKDADYFLILTPSYQYGDIYMQEEKKEPVTGKILEAAKEVQRINGVTSVDLYDAKTGVLLRHLCDITEKTYEHPITVKDGKTLQYPQITPADVLGYIYKNINNPDVYQITLSRMEGLKEYPKKGQTITIGNWEITYHSSSISKSFTEGDWLYEADDGQQYVKASFTVKNVGSKPAVFLPSQYKLDGTTTTIYITDANFKHFSSPIIPMDSKTYLNDAKLKPGQEIHGDLYFEVEDQALEGPDDLYFEISLGNQSIYYLLDK